eukprot:scaffold2740_cov418-Prasinococcus_capsulatus_cf.AAC.7
MPFYEALLMLRASLPKTEMQKLVQKVGTTVINNGGAVGDLTSYGVRPLAYTVRKSGDRHSQADMASMTLLTGPHVIEELVTPEARPAWPGSGPEFPYV